jgi:hypothetical protein
LIRRQGYRLDRFPDECAHPRFPGVRFDVALSSPHLHATGREAVAMIKVRGRLSPPHFPWTPSKKAHDPVEEVVAS